MKDLTREQVLEIRDLAKSHSFRAIQQILQPYQLTDPAITRIHSECFSLMFFDKHSSILKDLYRDLAAQICDWADGLLGQTEALGVAS